MGFNHPCRDLIGILRYLTINIHHQYGCHRISPKKMVIERNRIGDIIMGYIYINTDRTATRALGIEPVDCFFLGISPAIWI